MNECVTKVKGFLSVFHLLLILSKNLILNHKSHQLNECELNEWKENCRQLANLTAGPGTPPLLLSSSFLHSSILSFFLSFPPLFSRLKHSSTCVLIYTLNDHDCHHYIFSVFLYEREDDLPCAFRFLSISPLFLGIPLFQLFRSPSFARSSLTVHRVVM